MKNKFTFSGHETFHCRHFWLKKGYDFLTEGFKFSNDASVVELGVGKNMVSSIRFWMRSMGIINENDELTELAHFIFSEEGVDPYLENIATIWFLHYQLVKNNHASLTSFVFNELRKEKFEFTKKHIINFISRKIEENKQKVSDKVIANDVSVFLRNYRRPSIQSKNIEDDFSGLFLDLNLIIIKNNIDFGQGDLYVIESQARNSLPYQIALFAIIDQNASEKSISFYKLLNHYNSIGNVFALSESSLLELIEKMTEQYSDLVFSDDAGIRELQLKSNIDKWQILKEYYETKL